jgi:dipeptide/tripeptide permease
MLQSSDAQNQIHLYSVHTMNVLLKRHKKVRYRTRGICTPFTQWIFYWNITAQSGTGLEASVLRSHSERSIETLQGSQAQNLSHLYSVHRMTVLLKHHRAVRHRTRVICTPFTRWPFYWNITGQSGTEPESFVVVSQETLFYWKANKTN